MGDIFSELSRPFFVLLVHSTNTDPRGAACPKNGKPLSNSLKAAAAQKKGAPTPPFAEGMVALRQHAAQPQQPRPQLAQVTPTLARLLLHAYSYTPILTRLLLHAYSYTPQHTRRSSRARSSRKSRLLLHAYSCTPTFTRLLLHAHSYTPTLTRRSSRALSSRRG